LHTKGDPFVNKRDSSAVFHILLILFKGTRKGVPGNKQSKMIAFYNFFAPWTEKLPLFFAEKEYFE
jgi:hypothetical protein